MLRSSLPCLLLIVLIGCTPKKVESPLEKSPPSEIARARALVRRAAGKGAPLQSVGELSIDPNRMKVSVRGVPVPVTALEYRLVSYLMHHHGKVVPPTELLEHLYGDDDAREANALEAVITRLRRKLGKGIIGTRRGFGYYLETGEAEA